MGIEDAKNPDTAEHRVEIPVADMPKAEQPVVQKEISPEKRKQAESTVLDTLEIESTENLDNFDEKLKKATKSLPRYQQIEKKLEGIERQNLPHELFKVLKRDSDEEQTDSNVPKDGVLIKSMRQGKLECAGRTLIASTFLQEHGIDHVAVSAPGHAFLVIEQSPDTLAYFDANNNLFFTFPRTALEGYQGTETSSECRLKEYTPREADFADGVNTTFSQFVAMPAKEAVGRQYLGNVAAALNGNKEFETTGIEVNQEASEATHQLETELYGENKVLESFYDRVEGLLEQEEMQTADDKKVIGEIQKTHPTHDDFVAFFTMVLNGNIGNRILYIKNATPEQKKDYAEKVWDFLQKRNINETIRGR
jgi:hypothetical protein